jgi:hypothetical protein
MADLDQLRRLVPACGGAALRADLENFARGLDFVINLKRLRQIARHRLFHINMFAGIERGQAVLQCQ